MERITRGNTIAPGGNLSSRYVVLWPHLMAIFDLTSFVTMGLSQRLEKLVSLLKKSERYLQFTSLSYMFSNAKNNIKPRKNYLKKFKVLETEHSKSRE